MDYEKMYKAVLKTATQWIKDGCSDKEKICLESVFPELRESEDERIRKEIIHYILYKASGVPEKQEHEWVSYLEKQKDLDKMIVVSPDVWDNAISDAYENGKKECEKQKELPFVKDVVLGLPGLYFYDGERMYFRGSTAMEERQKENPKSADSIPSDCTSDAKCGNSRHKVGDSLEGRKLADEVVAYLIKSGYQPNIKDTLDQKHFQIKIPRHKEDFFQSKEYKHCREILGEYYYEGDFAGDVYTLYVLRQKEPHYTKRNALFDKCVENCEPKTVEEVNKRVDDIINMPELSAFEQALTNLIGYWEDDEERWPSKFVKKHGKHILDMAREELKKEHQFCSDAPKEKSVGGDFNSLYKDKNLDEIAQDYVEGVKEYNPVPTWDLMQTAVCYGYRLSELLFEKNRLANCDALSKEEYDRETDFAMEIIEKEHRQPTFNDAINYGMRLLKEQRPVEYLSKDKVYAIMNRLTELSTSELIPLNSDEYKKINEITSDVRSLLDYPIEEKPAEWSEEDKEMYARVVRRYTDYEGVIMRTKEESVADKMLDAMAQEEIWLKSLRPSWKPSEEQMKALCSKLPIIKGSGDKVQDILQTLYDDLKKLGVKEEPEYYQHFDPDC